MVDYEPGDGRFRLDLVSVLDGLEGKWAVYAGKEYRSKIE